MNLFEKIHNYQILSRLEKSNTYLLTSLEKSWLKTMLNHPDAPYFFSQDTLEKLRVYLDPYEKLPLDELFLEKAKSKEENRHHPFLSPLREIILKKNFVRLTTRTRTDRIFREQIGAPYKLEYSLTKKQWYLLWLHPKRKSVISTPLRLIQLAEEVESSDEEYDLMIQALLHRVESRKQTANILIPPEYNQELSRILYAFSCFERDLTYREETGTYLLTLTYLVDESEYVLSKIRFLGQRVRVIENEYLIGRMRESSQKALERYQ